MTTAHKILLIMGIAYVLLGGTIGIGLLFSDNAQGAAAIPFLFLLLGIGFIVGVVMSLIKKKNVIAKGTKYSGKIYGYVDNTSITVNGKFPINTKVHYFDEHGNEKEAIIPTSFDRGSNQYPIGMTIDIYEYQGIYGFDPKSVRNETLPNEAELMDNKPLEPDKMKLVAVSCPNCGASFEAVQGYTERCPYCGSYHNA